MSTSQHLGIRANPNHMTSVMLRQMANMAFTKARLALGKSAEL